MSHVTALFLFLSVVSCFQIRNTAIFDRGLLRDRTFLDAPSLRKVTSSHFMTGHEIELESHFTGGFGPDMMQLIVQAASMISKPLNGDDRYVYKTDCIYLEKKKCHKFTIFCEK